MAYKSREYHNQYNIEWRKRNPDYMKEYHHKHRLKIKIKNDKTTKFVDLYQDVGE